jgi:tetratricopeptide (TPR) repeat protein
MDNLGVAYEGAGDLKQAMACYEQALTVNRSLGDRQWEAVSLSSLGSAYQALEDPQQAINYYEQALLVNRAIGNRYREGHMLNNLGNASATLGNSGQAISYYEECLTITRATGDQHTHALASWNLGEELTHFGEYIRAANLMQVLMDYQRALHIAEAEDNAAVVVTIRAQVQAVAQGRPAAVPPNMLLADKTNTKPSDKDINKV